MKAFEIESFGLEGLKPARRAELQAPARGEVLVRIKACSLNYRDLMMLRGEYNPRQPLPLIPLSDGVGEVIAVGEHATHFSVGDRVCGTVCQDWIAGTISKEISRSTLGSPLDGMLCEQRLFPEHGLVKVPGYLSNEEASTLPCAALTAWRAIFGVYKLEPGETVLLQGTGGVSLFALQFAKTCGARVVIISSSDEKLEKAKAMGADVCINYKTHSEWSKGLQVDLVLELGGAATIEQSIKAVRPAGQINLIGRLGGGKTEIDLVPIFMRDIRVQGLFVGPRESFEAMNHALEQHQIKPVIDRVFDFNDAPEAFKYLESAQHMGKIVVKL